MKEIEVTGLVSKISGKYVITVDDGIEYELSSIKPWESTSPDINSAQYAENIGRRMIASGFSDGGTIWSATLTPPD
ncbi:MAG: hypothetical protein ACTSU3_00360 [Candidatus Thorarchaeota archaeon]